MHWLAENINTYITFSDILWLLFYYMIIAVFLINVLTPRFNRAVTLAAMPALWYINVFPLHFENMPEWMSQVLLLSIIAFAIIFFKDKLIKRLLFGALSMAVLFISDALTFFILEYLGSKLGIYYENIAGDIAMSVPLALIFYIIYRIYERLSSNARYSARKRGASYFMPLVIFIASEILFFILISETILIKRARNIVDYQRALRSDLLLFVFIFLILDIIIYTTLKRNAEIQKKELYYKTLENQYKLEVDYYKKMQKSINETTKMRHDINNILQVIKIELANNSDEGRQKVSEFTDEIEKIMEKSKIRRFCENRIINTVLYDKSERAAALGIDLDDNVFVGERCGVDDFDLCRVFINILDNATNALSGYIGDEKRIIHISCREADGFLYIQCQNSYSEKDGDPQKKNGSGEHGYGLQIIEETAKKYGGELVTDSSNGVFSTLVTLRAGAENPRQNA